MDFFSKSQYYNNSWLFNRNNKKLRYNEWHLKSAKKKINANQECYTQWKQSSEIKVKYVSAQCNAADCRPCPVQQSSRTNSPCITAPLHWLHTAPHLPLPPGSGNHRSTLCSYGLDYFQSLMQNHVPSAFCDSLISLCTASSRFIHGIASHVIALNCPPKDKDSHAG